ncbi:SIS domain-containing protein [Alteromonas gracilis]|uniref:SIS domain-containing protein n=1 Tax=Alteromonas gracilis TaxID=1479524 RepID=UPI002FE25204
MSIKLARAKKLKSVEQLVFSYTKRLTEVLNYLEPEKIERFIDILISMKEQNGTLYICGNGGSAANAIHLANDFTFGISPAGDAIKVEALPANSSVVTCLGNDIGYENIFSHQLKVKAHRNDVLLILSGSGNSKNIINAINQAQMLGITTVGILGYQGGSAKSLVDLSFHFEIDDMQIAEDTQVIIGHILMKGLKEYLLRAKRTNVADL